MKKVSTEAAAKQKNLRAEVNRRTDWTWAIARAGIACWMKRAACG
jgi:hypothetical protein